MRAVSWPDLRTAVWCPGARSICLGAGRRQGAFSVASPLSVRVAVAGVPGAAAGEDVRWVVLMARRVAIVFGRASGYAYYQLSGGSAALASIGLIAFLGVAQVLPAMLGGIFWRGATRTGAILGLVIGLSVWAFTSFLPSFGPGAVLPQTVFADGLFGLSWLRPHSLFGTEAMDSWGACPALGSAADRESDLRMDVGQKRGAA